MKLFILLACFCLIQTVATAQNANTVSGTVNSKNSKAVDAATVSLLRAKDSATVKITAVNKEGSYSFENISAGKYLISVTAIGHQKSYSNQIELAQLQQPLQMPVISLLPANKDLAAVVITAKRPLIEQ